MNAIVSFYKNFILGILFVVLVAGMVAIFLIAGNGDLPAEQRWLVSGAIVGGVALTFLIVAWSALIISMHDRHNEIAEGVHRIAQALEDNDRAPEIADAR